MWIYIVVFLMITDVEVGCPNGLRTCKVKHVKQDTVKINTLEFCNLRSAEDSYRWHTFQLEWKKKHKDVNWSHNAVKLDSVFQKEYIHREIYKRIYKQ